MVNKDHVTCLANNFANKRDVSVGLVSISRKSGLINRRKLFCCKDVVMLDFKKKSIIIRLFFLSCDSKLKRMKIRDEKLIQKYYLNVFNGIFLALGLMLLTFGLWLLFDRNNLFSVLCGGIVLNCMVVRFFLFVSSAENQLVTCISCIILGIGSAIMFTSAIGFLGSVVEIKCLLVTYMSFHILVFVTQMAILVLIITKKEEVHNEWNNRIDEVISEYGNESLAEQEPVWNILNAVQHNMECCGRYNATQWERNKNKKNSTQIPCSCIKFSLKKWFCDAPRDSAYSMGCEEHLNIWFENNVLTLTAITTSLLITQIFLITLTHRLFRNLKKNNIWPNES